MPHHVTSPNSDASNHAQMGMRWLFLLLLVLSLALPLSGSEILVVLSADKPPYRQAEKGLTGVLTIAGTTTRSVLLDDLVKNTAPLTKNTLVASIGTPAANWLHQHAPQTRVIFCLVADPIGAGLSDPPIIGGVPTDVPIEDQLALIQEAMPQARTLGMLYRSDQERSSQLVSTLRKNMPSHWKLEAIAIDQHDGPAAAIDSLLDRSIDLVWTTPDTSIFNEATVRTLLLTALRRRIPVFGFSPAFVRAGGLIGVGVNPSTLGAQAGTLLLRLQAENKDIGLPVMIPPTFEICVNLVVAQKLSIDLPPALVKRSTHVFQSGP